MRSAVKTQRKKWAEAIIKHNLLFFLFRLEVILVSRFVWVVNILIEPVLKFCLCWVSFISCYLQGFHGYKKKIVFSSPLKSHEKCIKSKYLRQQICSFIVKSEFFSIKLIHNLMRLISKWVWIWIIFII